MSISLRDWINPRYLPTLSLQKLYASFSSNKPFPHLVLPSLFLPEKLERVTKALQRENFHLKDADLFTFYQTDDLKGTTNKILLEFRDLLSSSEFIQFMSSITGIRLIPRKIDLAGTLYTLTHHLLPHDDDLENRKVAFMLYLTTLQKKDGGALGLYASENRKATTIVKRIQPQANTFVFFTVSKSSFHEVEEVLSNQKRVALSGWFYDQ